TPMATMSSSRISLARSIISPRIASGSSAGVSLFARSSTDTEAVTRNALIFVPPTSIPIASPSLTERPRPSGDVARARSADLDLLEVRGPVLALALEVVGADVDHGARGEEELLRGAQQVVDHVGRDLRRRRDRDADRTERDVADDGLVL